MFLICLYIPFENIFCLKSVYKIKNMVNLRISVALCKRVVSGTCDVLALNTFTKTWCKRVASGTCDPLALNTFVKY